MVRIAHCITPISYSFNRKDLEYEKDILHSRSICFFNIMR